MSHKSSTGYETVLKMRRLDGWVPTLSLLDDAYLAISGHVLAHGWHRYRADLICLHRSQVKFEDDRYGRGYVRFIRMENSKAYVNWLFKNLPEVMKDVNREIHLQKKAHEPSPSVHDDVAMITSFRIEPQQAIQELEVQQAIPAPGAAPVEKGIERLRDLLAESQRGVLNRIESLVDLVEAQQSALKQQSLTIEALKDQVGLLAASQTHTAISSNNPRPSLIERLFS